jgi:hypothetical protein
MELTTLITVAGWTVALALVGVVFYFWGKNKGYNECIQDQQDAEEHERRIQKIDNRIEAPRDPNAPRAVIRSANFRRSL